MSAFASSLRWELLAVLERERLAGRDPALADAPAESFEAVYRDHHRDVYRYVLLSLRRRDDAVFLVGPLEVAAP